MQPSLLAKHAPSLQSPWWHKYLSKGFHMRWQNNDEKYRQTLISSYESILSYATIPVYFDANIWRRFYNSLAVAGYFHPCHYFRKWFFLFQSWHCHFLVSTTMKWSLIASTSSSLSDTFIRQQWKISIGFYSHRNNFLLITSDSGI